MFMLPMNLMSNPGFSVTVDKDGLPMLENAGVLNKDTSAVLKMAGVISTLVASAIVCGDEKSYATALELFQKSFAAVLATGKSRPYPPALDERFNEGIGDVLKNFLALVDSGMFSRHFDAMWTENASDADCDGCEHYDGCNSSNEKGSDEKQQPAPPPPDKVEVPNEFEDFFNKLDKK